MLRVRRAPRPDGEAGASRRGFLRGVLAGAGGLAAAVALLPRAGSAKATAGTSGRANGTPEPILYHRTEYVDRYFRTLT